MRIGLIVYGSLDTISGGYLYDRQLVAYLRAQGDEVDVISLPWRTYGRHLLDNWRPGLRRRMVGPKYDLLLQDELNHPSLFWLNRRLQQGGAAPIVAIVHHLRSQEPHNSWANVLYRHVERLYLNRVDGFIFNGHDSERTVRDLLDGPRPAVVAQPAADHLDPTVTDAVVASRAHEPGPLKVLFVGGITARKGVMTLLEAAASLAPGTVELHIAGSRTVEPRYVAALTRLQTTLWPAGSLPLHWYGQLSPADLRPLYGRCHLFVMPSAYEGFGIAYLEAMGFGLPAIGTTAGGAKAIIHHGENGFLITPGAVDELTAHMRILAGDRASLAAMGANARRFFQAQPGWADTGRLIRSFLKEMIANE